MQYFIGRFKVPAKVLELDENELEAAACLWQYNRDLPQIREALEKYIEGEFEAQVKTSGKELDFEFCAAEVSDELLDEIADVATSFYVYESDFPADFDPVRTGREVANAVWSCRDDGRRYADLIVDELVENLG